jgi:hypothetical protein
VAAIVIRFYRVVCGNFEREEARPVAQEDLASVAEDAVTRYIDDELCRQTCHVIWPISSQALTIERQEVAIRSEETYDLSIANDMAVPPLRVARLSYCWINGEQT